MSSTRFSFGCVFRWQAETETVFSISWKIKTSLSPPRIVNFLLKTPTFHSYQKYFLYMFLFWLKTHFSAAKQSNKNSSALSKTSPSPSRGAKWTVDSHLTQVIEKLRLLWHRGGKTSCLLISLPVHISSLLCGLENVAPHFRGIDE